MYLSGKAFISSMISLAHPFPQNNTSLRLFQYSFSGGRTEDSRLIALIGLCLNCLKWVFWQKSLLFSACFSELVVAFLVSICSFTVGQFVTSLFQEVKAKAGICDCEAGGCKNITVMIQTIDAEYSVVIFGALNKGLLPHGRDDVTVYEGHCSIGEDLVKRASG